MTTLTQTLSPASLQHGLTDEQRIAFERDGFFAIEDALAPQQVKALEAATDSIHQRHLDNGLAPNERLFYGNFIPDNPLFLDLVDYEPILPKVWDILGWNIYLYHAHMIITPPGQEAANDRTFGWHQDSGRINVEIESSPRPRISLKVGYFLSDTSETNRGNFWVVPGSHLWDSIDRPANGEGQPEGAIPVLAKPGTAVFFDRRIWHAGTPNWSNITRKVLFYGYGYRWIRTKDDMTVQHLWQESDPIRRQLLGWGSNANGFFSPQEEDVPLRTWLREHQPERAN